MSIAPEVLVSAIFLLELLMLPVVILPTVVISKLLTLVKVEVGAIAKLANGLTPPTMPLKKMELPLTLRDSALFPSTVLLKIRLLAILLSETSPPKVTGLLNCKALVVKIFLFKVVLPLVKFSTVKGTELVPIAPKDIFPVPASIVSA